MPIKVLCVLVCFIKIDTKEAIKLSWNRLQESFTSAKLLRNYWEWNSYEKSVVGKGKIKNYKHIYLTLNISYKVFFFVFLL